MPTEYSPRIVTDGLVLCLDAANKKSYSGSGTNLIDLSGNFITGSLINGTGFDTNNLGSFMFDGTNDYIQLSNSSAYKVQFPITVGCFFKVQTLSNYGILIRTDNTDNRHWGVFISIDSNYKININYGNGTANAPSGRRTYITDVSLNQDQWYNFIAVLPDNLNCVGYLNGNLINTPYAQGSATTLVYGSVGGTIGFRTDTAGFSYFKGNISNIQFYNRALSPTEIQRNYNALKGRFGL